ncbi:MAG: hypothetical protein WDZ29_05935 [Balneolaceae bacterium]
MSSLTSRPSIRSGWRVSPAKHRREREEILHLFSGPFWSMFRPRNGSRMLRSKC